MCKCFSLLAMVLDMTYDSQADQSADWCSVTIPYKMSMEKMTNTKNFKFFVNIFGELYMADEPLTVDPSPNSRLFNGSTISIFTRNPVNLTDRELTIVGGIRYFQFASGFITANTYWDSGKKIIKKISCITWHLQSAQADQIADWCCETFPYKMSMEKMSITCKIGEAPGISNSSSTLFGELYMLDIPLTVGPALDSRVIGRAQCLCGFSDQNDFAFTMGISLVFTGIKKFNGSTINIFTRNPISHTDREFAIVGGTGYFQYARGYKKIKKFLFGHRFSKDPKLSSVVLIFFFLKLSRCWFL
ncbi:hypothetical protein MKW94_027795 [Papaver nudicaule]|uniref:Dirigent protein n=1 Tax=Papaver nudicaule TaxID=74823 RepID=A0AA41VV23_PAPNU|nr:hypothetical protein [Papaver nudicaule]